MLQILFFIPLFIISIIAKCLLFSIGWGSLQDSVITQITNNNRAVLVFSHTSYCDFYILLLYLFAYPRVLRSVRVLVKPQPFSYAGFILYKLGAIPATQLQDKNGGAVNRIVDELKRQEKFLFLISPKGTIVKTQWRSGYYYIAKALNASLAVAGLDYEKKCVVLSDNIRIDQEESTVREDLYKELKEIVPLFPDEEVVPIRKHNPNNIGIINPTYLLGTGIILSLIILIS